MEKRIKETLEEVENKRDEGNRRKVGWWDGDCKEAKRKIRMKLREWRKKGEGEEKYRGRKKEYREICEKKKREWNKEWERKIKEVKREHEVWEIVNRERKGRKRVNEGIKMGEWKEYFMSLLGGVEVRVVKGGGVEGREEEEEIGRGEFRKVIKKLSDGKAWGLDGIPGEVWKYGGEELEGWIREFCNRIWRGEGWPEEWKEGIIVPIVKKGEGERVKEYKRVTLMSTAYKLYAAVLAERMREEIEGKKLIPHNQTGFKKGMGTVDNIYAEFLINRQIGKGGN